MGERTIAAAIASASERAPEDVALVSGELGDLGLAAESLIPGPGRSRLAVSHVCESLLSLARTGGKGSSESKREQLAALLRSATPTEVRYIVRITQGRLRLGVAAPTIIESVARLEEDPKRARQTIERAFNLCSDLGAVLTAVREGGLGALSSFKVRVGNPVRPMLAGRLPSAEKIIEKIGRRAVEAKLDGFRCQVHLKSRRVEMFSRNLERTTAMFPDIAVAVRNELRARSAIIDGEALAINEETGEFHPFQVTVQRKRKHQVAEAAEEFPLVLVAFDLYPGKGQAHGLCFSVRPGIEPPASLRNIYRELQADVGFRICSPHPFSHLRPGVGCGRARRRAQDGRTRLKTASSSSSRWRRRK